MLFNDVMFLDLSHLRFGSFVDTYIDKSTGKRVIVYRPLNKMLGRSCIIENIPVNEGNFIEIPRLTGMNSEGSFSKTVVLLRGESGNAPFFDQWMAGTGGEQMSKATKMIEQVERMKQQMDIQAAALESKERMLNRGELDKLKTIDEQLKVFDRDKQKKNKFSGRGFSGGD
jgi:hypothetical protein